ncbi:hypothetical protein MKX03_014449 [Papaver bracteatum]|nr:hypothetical protein MKX03_014449 [Papaver bracteatum]
MEWKNVKMISLMVIVMLGMFVEESSAWDFDKTCYVKCLAGCAWNRTGDEIYQCPFICVPKCWISGTSPNSYNFYCQYGCAISKCLKKSTPKDPRGEEVEHCVNSYCGDKCKK